MFVGEICLVVFVFVFYFVPDAKEKLGLFPQAAMQDAIVKYGIVDDDDMVNLIDNIQQSVSVRQAQLLFCSVKAGLLCSERSPCI